MVNPCDNPAESRLGVSAHACDEPFPIEVTCNRLYSVGQRPTIGFKGVSSSLLAPTGSRKPDGSHFALFSA
jgi:hypothetical protein